MLRSLNSRGFDFFVRFFYAWGFGGFYIEFIVLYIMVFKYTIMVFKYTYISSPILFITLYDLTMSISSYSLLLHRFPALYCRGKPHHCYCHENLEGEQDP